MSKATPRKARSPKTKKTAKPDHKAASAVTVSPRWLLGAVFALIALAAMCAWATLCLLFWQGSWQLLYHPTSAVTSTPASTGLPFDSIAFDSDSSGAPQLRGWWIPAQTRSRYVALYLHGANGNLGDTVHNLSTLHSAGIDVFAFDYRGYGESAFQHPGERRMLADANAALDYLINTRHVPPQTIVLAGKELGANVALEVAAGHSELGGIILQEPLENPVSVIFNDPRAHLVPAHLLVRDRWDTLGSTSKLRIPSLWLYWTTQGQPEQEDQPQMYRAVSSRKMLVWIPNSPDAKTTVDTAIHRFLDELAAPIPGR